MSTSNSVGRDMYNTLYNTGYKTGARYSQNACERLRSSTQVSTLARNIEYQKAKRHRGCLHYDLFIAQL